MNSRTPFSRREFLQLSTAAVAGAGLAGAPRLLGAAPKKQIPIALELYSVREDCAKNLDATIEAVAKMGYVGVEFAGYHGRDAKTLRKILDANGLKCCGTHIGLDTLQGDKLPKTIEFNQVLGNKFLIVPGLPESRTKSRKAWRETADLFNEISDQVKPHGMRTGYHNHTIEFQPLDGELPWDTFFGNTRKEVIMQFDTGNAMQGGGDATIYLAKYPGRAATVHIKPYSKSKPAAIIGEDDLPWEKILTLCETSGGTEWYVVEYEVEGQPALESCKKCLQALKQMGRGA